MYHETKVLNMEHIFGMLALILKAVYLKANILLLNVKIIAELELSGLGFWDHILLNTLTSK